MKRGLLNILPGLLVLAALADLIAWRGGPLAGSLVYVGAAFAVVGLPVLLLISIIVAAIRWSDRRC
jgi:hypothetical protein